MLNEVEKILKQWLPPISEEEKVRLRNILLFSKKGLGEDLFDIYVRRLNPYLKTINVANPREPDCLASGFIFFYGCILYTMQYPDWMKYMDNCFYYNLLYILVDHFIDDNSLSESSKGNAMVQMIDMCTNPYNDREYVDQSFVDITNVYIKIIENSPDSKQYILALLLTEIEGYKIQKDNTLSEEDYYNIAVRKGGITMLVLNSFVENSKENNDEAYNIGALMQLLDDCMDCICDKRNSHNTIATYHLQKYGNLDKLFFLICDRISNLKGAMFKILYCAFAVYIPETIPQYFSEELIEITKQYNILTHIDCANLIINTMITKM